MFLLLHLSNYSAILVRSAMIVVIRCDKVSGGFESRIEKGLLWKSWLKNCTGRNYLCELVQRLTPLNFPFSYGQTSQGGHEHSIRQFRTPTHPIIHRKFPVLPWKWIRGLVRVPGGTTGEKGSPALKFKHRWVSTPREERATWPRSMWQGLCCGCVAHNFHGCGNCHDGVVFLERFSRRKGYRKWKRNGKYHVLLFSFVLKEGLATWEGECERSSSFAALLLSGMHQHLVTRLS